jgi:phosphatidylglycerophosphatase A
MSQPSTNLPTTNSEKRKPRLSLAIATAFGLGYIPIAPGTFGSLVGVAVTALFWFRIVLPTKSVDIYIHDFYLVVSTSTPHMLILVTFLVSGVGVIVASSVATYLGKKDPQIVVVDEVSGQLISYLGIGGGMLNWKYLLLGFILFRVFDIWKPFPARQAESLPGGLGIMADDWIAGIYAALGLWIARAVGI